MSHQYKKKRVRRSHNDALPLFLLGTGLLILGLTAYLILPRPAESASKPAGTSAIPAKVEYPAPELELVDLEGKPVSLRELQGQIVLVNNWATWCPPCRAEMPALEAFYQDHRHKNFTLVAVDAGEPAKEVIQFVESFGLTFSVWQDPNGKALQAFRNPALPNSFVIDAGGIVRLAWTGAISLEVLEKHVAPMLEEQEWEQK